MLIRALERSNENEIERLYEVQQSAYLVEAKLLGLEPNDFFPLRETLHDLLNSTDETFVFIEEHSMIGAISLEKLDGSILISKLVVDPSFFRKGIAKSLIAYCLRLYPTSVFQVGTGAENHPALKLYYSFGFRIFVTETVEPQLKIAKLRRELLPS